jgi:serine/threonine-protein kinase
MDLLDRLSAVLSGRYQVERELGHGGMALVFLARDLKIDRQVAIKVLRPELTQSIGAERFVREIQIAANLQHPHILPVFDSGQTDGLLYYVMPYVEGATLRTHLEREGQLSIEECLRITREVAEGIDEVHKHDIVHRDVKPENIFLSGDHAVLADFGIAHAYTEAGGATFTDSGIAVGTPQYMSPEQVAGDQRIDGRCDVYQLGCVVYEMLTGGPPFEGPTTQAVILKQLQERVPSLDIVRPGIPGGMVKAVEKALAKVPADRFRTALDFARALESGAEVSAAPGGKRAVRTTAIAGIALAVGLLLGWRLLYPPGLPLDPNRVVVFPLAETGLQRLEPGIGGLVAEMIGTALEGAEALRWTYGGSWLQGEERGDPSRVSVQLADSIAERVRARYHVLGSVVERGDSAHVILRLHDVRLHDEVDQRTAPGLVHIDSVVRSGYRATIGIVADLLEGDRAVDLSAVIERNPAAVTLWMRGDQEYRRSRFAQALEFYRRALESDSLLAMAALKGALAANWEHRNDEAEDLLAVALRPTSGLAENHVHFALGLQHYFTGNADSAIARFTAALDRDPDWPEAWTALAETHRHLLADGSNPDSIAVAGFQRAIEVDPEFTPPLKHLVEYAIWRGEIEQAERFADRFREVVPDSALSLGIDLMVRCVRDGPSMIAWDGLAAVEPLRVLEAAFVFGVRGTHPECAEVAYRAVLESARSSREVRLSWGALLGLQSLLLAVGRVDEARQLLDANAAGSWLYLLDAAAGFPCEDRAYDVARTQVPDYRIYAVPTLWLFGQWVARRDSAALVTDIAALVSAKAESTQTRRDRLVAKIMRAYAALASADTTAAVGRFQDLKPTGRKADILWDPWESLGAERMVLAELLFGQGRYEEAYNTAALLEHPEPVPYLLYFPGSLDLRARAAEAMGRRDVADRHRRQLEQLRSPAGRGGR